MNGKFHSFTRSIEVIAGLLAVNLCFIIASVFDMEIVGFRWKVTWMTVNLSFLPAIYLISRRNILPAEGLETTLRNSTAYIALHALSFFAMLSLLNYWTHNRSFYFWFYASFVITLPALEFTARRLSKALRKRLGGINSSIIIGTGPTARRLKEELISNSGHGYSFSGFFSNDTAGSDELGDEYKGPVTELENYIKATPVHDIYFTLSGEDYDTLRHVARVADDNLVQLYMVPQMSHYIGRVHELSAIGNVPILNVRANPLKHTANKLLKRGIDIVGATLVAVTSPLTMLPIALAIKLTSKGPVFFTQKRTGYLGKEFTCLKFRTMFTDSTDDTRQVYRGDPRITPLGRFLRHTSLDELPQFFNVLKGDMSIVGPRPHIISQTGDYGRLINRYMIRHFIKPGITGWAQVNGYRGQTEQLWKMEKRVEYDVWYMEHWSLALDLKIMLMTLRDMIFPGKNIY